MEGWAASLQHKTISSWARAKKVPVITTNYDTCFAKAVDATRRHIRDRNSERGFTAYYPWESYFSTEPVLDVCNSFGVWHAHGVLDYSSSIRLGLNHYMGSVQRVRGWINGDDRKLLKYAKCEVDSWKGKNTWLEAFFFSPMMIFGIDLGKDETFFRWLLLERAKLHKAASSIKKEAWFINCKQHADHGRTEYFKRLGVETIFVESYQDIYENPGWSVPSDKYRG